VLRPFRVGEYIETSSVSGTVEEIGLFATELRTPEGLYRLAPNSTLWNTPVTNYSRRALRRHEISVPVAAGDDVKGVERQLLALARAQGTTENSPPPETFISDLTAANATVTLRYWVRNADWDRVTSRMREAVRNDIFGRKDAA